MAVNSEMNQIDALQPMGEPENAAGTMSASTLEGSAQPAAPEAPASAPEAAPAPLAAVPEAGPAASPQEPAINDVTSTSSESSAQSIGFDTGTGYQLSDQGGSITTGGEPGGYGQTIGSSGNSMMGDLNADGGVDTQSSSSETDYADGSSVSSDSSSFTGALDVGAMFQGPANNAQINSGGDDATASSDSASILGGLEAAALVTGETGSTDIENADGSSNSSDSGSLSAGLGLGGLLGGSAESSDSNDEGDSSSESASLLGTLDSVAGLTIEGSQNSSESADGEQSGSSELTIDLDTFLDGDGQSDYHAAATGGDGASSSYDQVNEGELALQNELGGTQVGDGISYGDVDLDESGGDQALLSIDLSGNDPLLGVSNDPDTLLGLDTGLSLDEHGGFG